ncbi:MAG: galactokinase family protein [bacterium]|nr:galactokinase family protein [bacterium]
MNYEEFLNRLSEGGFDEVLKMLYGEAALEKQKKRYGSAVRKFREIYPDRTEFSIFSAPGRTEIGGNHTDHQHGCVLAAAVDVDAIAVVSFHDEGIIRVRSEGYDEDIVNLAEFEVKKSEYGKSTELIRGIAAKFADKGVKIGGFDAYTTSNVIGGAGLSSSAAFEVLIGTIINEQYNDCRAGSEEIAKIGQYAENVYFGKQCGLMDQMACATGGLVFIDFADTEKPVVKKQMYDFSDKNLALCITDTKGSHADLTDDYVAVPSEMKQIASYFNKPYLRIVNEEEFYKAIPELRKKYSDRAVIRAAHFFDENKRAMDEAAALARDDIFGFINLVRKSGISSATLLQNLYSPKNPLNQEIPVALMVSERALAGSGAVRVHGGGFAGTIQAFVPLDKTDDYIYAMESLFGKDSCHIIHIRPIGGIKVDRQ